MSTGLNKAAVTIKDKWDNSSVGRFCNKAKTSVTNFYNEHKTVINTVAGITVIGVCAAATILTGGAAACTLAGVVSQSALIGSVTFGTGGALAGGLDAATDYMAEHGTIDGSTDAVLEGASIGFAGGSFTGAATGTLRGASDFTQNPGKYCFVAGTLILTTIGLMNIEDVRAGDYVYAENTETGETSYQAVLETYINQTEELYTVTIDGEEIKATPGHPFYTSEEGWVSAKDLEAGDKVTTAEGEEATVEEVKKEDLEEPVNVYNFNVMDYHTYYVGENSILVHNANGKSCSMATNTANEAKESLKEAIESGSKPNQVHHFATNKSKKYTSQFENITQKYGLDLDGDWNKELMPHQGRHPYAYHDYVLDNMQKFDKIAKGDETKFLKLYDQMKQKIINNPDMLYKDYWKKP